MSTEAKSHAMPAKAVHVAKDDTNTPYKFNFVAKDQADALAQLEKHKAGVPKSVMDDIKGKIANAAPNHPITISVDGRGSEAVFNLSA